jgi:PTS system mannose-specific IIA component
MTPREAKVGIVIVTHGTAGEAMLSTLARLLGGDAVEGVSAVDISVGEDRAHVKQRVSEAVVRADVGAGVVVACDLHGSTPTRCAVELMHDGVVAVVCGVNLPMLVKLLTAPRVGVAPDDVARQAVDTAVRSIRVEGATK